MKNEINVTKRLNGAGVIPIFESGITPKHAYYIMPKYEPITHINFIDNSAKILEYIKQLSFILRNLSEKKIFHRDLKPNNILVNGNQVFLIDLGIVKDENSANILTKEQERLGSLTYIAPERIRPQKNSKIDNEKADVYSFGMTIWALITGEKQGIGSQYSKLDEKNSFTAKKIDFKGISLYEELIIDSTSSNPAQRPTFREINELLNNPKLLNYDFFFQSNFLTQLSAPDYTVWSQTEEIVNIFENVIKNRYRLELLIPSSGGWAHIHSIKKSTNYSQFIEIDCGMQSPILLSPSMLVYINKPQSPYYILEAKKFIPFKKNLNCDEILEWMQPVCELAPYHFTYERCFYANDFNSSEIQNSAKIFQMVTNGRFLIQPLASGTNYIESLWNKDKNIFNIKLPLLEEKEVENRSDFIFIEPTSFSSENTLFSSVQKKHLLKLIEFIKLGLNSWESQIKKDDLISFLNEDKAIKKFLSNCIRIAYEADFCPPFYPDFKKIYNYFDNEKKGIEYVENKYVYNSKDFLKRIYSLFYYYSNEKDNYLKKIQDLNKKYPDEVSDISKILKEMTKG